MWLREWLREGPPARRGWLEQARAEVQCPGVAVLSLRETEVRASRLVPSFRCEERPWYSVRIAEDLWERLPSGQGVSPEARGKEDAHLSCPWSGSVRFLLSGVGFSGLEVKVQGCASVVLMIMRHLVARIKRHFVHEMCLENNNPHCETGVKSPTEG